MANLSRDQLRQLAASVGFTGSDVDIAVAVALAESGGNPGAHNSTPPDDSYGLWQINMLGSLGPARRKRFGISNNTELFRPAVNARAAKIIHGESGWKAWTTYTRGTYKQHMTGSPGTPAGQPMTPDEAATPTEDLSIAGGIQSGLNAVGENIFKTGINIGGIVIAVVLGILGVLVLARGQVANLVPLGKLGKAVKKL